MKTRLIIINRDQALARGLKASFEQEGYKVDYSLTLKEALDKMGNSEYELILLDIVLPDGKGVAACKTIREYSKAPMIILTKKDEDISKILALEYGADDYITIPFNILELKARIRAVDRRIKQNTGASGDQVIRIGDFTINPLGRNLTVKGKNVSLTNKEFDLFYLLVSNLDKVFTREELLESLWGYEYIEDLRTVDVHVRRLREKIEEDPKNVEYIHTKWGTGYYFKSQAEKASIKE